MEDELYNRNVDDITLIIMGHCVRSGVSFDGVMNDIRVSKIKLSTDLSKV